MQRMRPLLVFVVLSGCAASQPREVTVPSARDEQAILGEIQAFSSAWSRGDAATLAAFYTEDGVRVGAAGDVQRGRRELQAAYAELLGGPFKGAQVTQEQGSVRMLAPDLALWQGAIEITPSGGTPIEGYAVQVMKKVDGRWLILEGHPKLYPPPPAK